jgi:hypothetical protein
VSVGQRYICWDAAVPTTGKLTPIALVASTTAKTLLAVTAGSTDPLDLVEWGCTFDGAALGAGIEMELMETTNVAPTGGTAVTPTNYTDPNAVASNSTAMFGPTAEGTIVATCRVFDACLVDQVSGYFKQFPLGERPQVKAGNVLRIRYSTPAGVAPNCLCYAIWAE